MRWFLALLLLLALPARAGDLPQSSALGGDTSRATRGLAALSLPAANLTFEETERFFRGFLLFHGRRGEEATDDQAGVGLGPLYNATSCGACHENDGRGPAPRTGQAVTRSTLQISRWDKAGWSSHPALGGQLQPLSTQGPGEGVVTVQWEEIRGHTADGRLYRLRRPLLSVQDAALAPDDSLSLRLPPALTGLGLLEAVPEVEIRRLAKAGQGQARELETGALGRFGWKAERASLSDQVALAAQEDIGLSSSRHPDGDAKPELTQEALADLTFYSQVLAVPLAESLPTQERGAALFAELGCAVCHRPSMKTGQHELAALSDQEIHPFTDLLLHDMGPGLADRRLDGRLSDHPDARLWRTPALWGLGKAEQVAGALALLHDGRARSLAEAILWHGGEAAPAKRAYVRLDASDRAALLAFLEAL